MPRRARKPLIPSRASRSRSCSCSAGVISCRVSVDLPPDRVCLIDQVCTWRFREMIVGKQMASGRDVGQKLAYRLVDNHQSRSPPLTPGIASVRHCFSRTQRLIVCLASPRQSASSAGVILSFSFIMVYRSRIPNRSSNPVIPRAATMT